MSSSAEDAVRGAGSEHGTSEPARTLHSAEAMSADGDLAHAAGLNPSLEAAFAALTTLVGQADEADGTPHSPSPDRDAARRTALSRAASRLDGSIAVLTEARRALAGEAPAAAVAAAEAECRRLSRDLALYFPSLSPATESQDALPGRREFDRVIARLVGAERPDGRPSSMILVGVDRLSRLEAAHGEGASDDVLAAVGRAMTASFSGIARVFRFDLDVHAAVLPGVPLRQAVAVAEHLRRSVLERRLVRRSTGATLGHVTLSAGVVRASVGDEAAAAADRAVRCLGQAQWHGGNRVVCETDPAFEHALRAIA